MLNLCMILGIIFGILMMLAIPYTPVIGISAVLELGISSIVMGGLASYLYSDGDKYK